LLFFCILKIFFSGRMSLPFQHNNKLSHEIHKIILIWKFPFPYTLAGIRTHELLESEVVPLCTLRRQYCTSVARWFIFKPKIPINNLISIFWRALDGKMLIYFIAIWNILLQTFWIFHDHLAHFFVNLVHISVLISCTKKNLATLYCTYICIYEGHNW
jgi:hypothetical protein